jgi:glycosyltransferase involved in cell wall biosynthesis
MTQVLHVQKVAGISGSETHLLDLLPGLRARGWDARMLVLHEGEDWTTEFVRRLRDQGVPTDTWRMRISLDPTVPLRILATRPTILHTHLVHADVLALPAGALRRVPVRISTKHGFNTFRENRAVATADRLAGRFARQIAISQGLADYLVETQSYPSGSFTVVHYGIDAGPEPPPPPPEPRLIYVGRLIPIKGVDVLLRAFEHARREVPNLTLELAGSGASEADLRAAAPDGVTFLGHVAPPGPLYERNAIAVVPSRGEGFGMVALEAAERGRASIVSRVGGLPEIVAENESGLVVPSDDVGALAQAIVELAQDPARVAAMGAAARARTLAEFTASAAIDGVDAVYREELDRRTLSGLAP